MLNPAYVDNDYVFTEPEFENLKVAVRSASEDMKDVNLAVLIDAGYQMQEH